MHDLAIELTSERLSEVNKSFTKPAIVGWRAKEWAETLELSAQCAEDSDVLGLQPASHDLIIHAMGLHWTNDPVGQLIQMRRALTPDGMMLAVLFGGQTLHELRTCLAEAEAQVTGGISPHIAPMGEIRDLGALVQRAGFAMPVADSVSQNVSYSSTRAVAKDLRAMGESNALAQRHKRGLSRGTLRKTDDIYAKNFADADGRRLATFELIFLTGWAPHPDQQKPLRPGSAQSRLAAALNTVEENPEKD